MIDLRGFALRIQRESMETIGILSSYFIGFGQYADTEWDMVPRWWQWMFDVGKERLADWRGCLEGGYSYWIFDVSIERGRYRILPPLRVTFTRWSEEGECEYEFVFPPYDWQIDFPWTHRRALNLRKFKRCEWWNWKAKGSKIGH